MANRTKHVAIILSDTLQTLGLRCLLADFFQPIEITTFSTLEAFNEQTEDNFDFYFTQSDFFILHADYFLLKRNKTILLLNEAKAPTHIPGINHITLNATEETIIEQLQQLFGTVMNHNGNEGSKDLSQREIDVLQLIVKGITNKEIADKLNISLNTVLTHRKNITSKLGIKTVPGLTFYAIMNGIISGDEIEF